MLSVSRSQCRRGLFHQEGFLVPAFLFEGPTLETVERRADDGKILCMDVVDGSKALGVVGAAEDVFEMAKDVV